MAHGGLTNADPNCRVQVGAISVAFTQPEDDTSAASYQNIFAKAGFPNQYYVMIQGEFYIEACLTASGQRGIVYATVFGQRTSSKAIDTATPVLKFGAPIGPKEYAFMVQNKSDANTMAHANGSVQGVRTAEHTAQQCIQVTYTNAVCKAIERDKFKSNSVQWDWTQEKYSLSCGKEGDDKSENKAGKSAKVSSSVHLTQGSASIDRPVPYSAPSNEKFMTIYEAEGPSFTCTFFIISEFQATYMGFVNQTSTDSGGASSSAELGPLRKARQEARKRKLAEAAAPSAGAGGDKTVKDDA